MHNSLIRWSWLIFTAAAAGCNNTATSGSSADPANPGSNEPVKIPAIVMSVGDLKNEREKDAPAWQEKYAGKTFELTGMFVDFGQSADGRPVMILDVERVDVFSVWCYTIDPKPWMKATPGQSVKLRGVVAESMTGAKIEKCEILEATGPVIAATAQRLATDVGKPSGAKDRFDSIHDGKYAIITGTVHSCSEIIPANGVKSYIVEFETTGSDGHVEVQCLANPEPEITRRGADKPIRVLALCEIATGTKVTLRKGILLDEVP